MTRKIKAPRSHRKPKKRFFDLPAELRNHVYEDVFEELVSPPKHPWDPRPLHSRFAQYVSLLSASHQVRAEAGPLFVGDYGHRIVFYFDNTTELLVFRERWKPDHPVIGNARFSLHTECDYDQEYHIWPFRQWMEAPWRQQPGYDRAWDLRLGLYSIESRACNNYWKPEKHGFQRALGNHSQCSGTQDCKMFEVLKWPTFKNDCQLTTYQYEDIRRRATPKKLVGRSEQMKVLVFEGMIADLEVKYCEREAADSTWLHTRGEKCEYSWCHVYQRPSYRLSVKATFAGGKLRRIGMMRKIGSRKVTTLMREIRTGQKVGR